MTWVVKHATAVRAKTAHAGRSADEGLRRGRPGRAARRRGFTIVDISASNHPHGRRGTHRDRLREDKIRHRGQGPLDLAAANGATKSLGGMPVWDRDATRGCRHRSCGDVRARRLESFAPTAETRSAHPRRWQRSSRALIIPVRGEPRHGRVLTEHRLARRDRNTRRARPSARGRSSQPKQGRRLTRTSCGAVERRCSTRCARRLSQVGSVLRAVTLPIRRTKWVIDPRRGARRSRHPRRQDLGLQVKGRPGGAPVRTGAGSPGRSTCVSRCSSSSSGTRSSSRCTTDVDARPRPASRSSRGGPRARSKR